jgi:hypothetical protein
MIALADTVIIFISESCHNVKEYGLKFSSSHLVKENVLWPLQKDMSFLANILFLISHDGV